MERYNLVQVNFYGAQPLYTVQSASVFPSMMRIHRERQLTVIRPTGCLPTYSIHSFIPLRLSFSRIQFQDVTKVSEVSLYLSESLDESYTPCKVAISIGTSFQELDQLDVIEVSKPEGWVCIRLEDEQSGQGFVLTEVVQIAIVESHLSGKDTHVRQVKIFGPIT